MFFRIYLIFAKMSIRFKMHGIIDYNVIKKLTIGYGEENRLWEVEPLLNNAGHL